MNLKHSIRSFLAAVCITSALSGINTLVGEPSVTKTTGTGTAVIADNDRIAARKAAVAAALEDAVRKAVGIYIKSESKVEDARSVGKTIIAKSEGYVKSHRILKEQVVGDALVVVVEAVVDDPAIRRDFADRLARFVQKHALGPCNFILLSVGVKKVQSQLLCSVNDPTIERDTIRILFPKSGWLKPKFYGTAMMPVARLDSNRMLISDGEVYTLKEAALLIRARKAQVRLKDPASATLVTRDLHLSGIYMAQLLDGNTPVRVTSETPFSAIDPATLERIIAILERAEE